LTSYEVDTLLAAVDYVFRVALKNDLGRSPFSNVMGARTLENGMTGCLFCSSACLIKNTYVIGTVFVSPDKVLLQLLNKHPLDGATGTYI